MAFCTQNLTIGVYLIKNSDLIELKNNRVGGLIGRHFDKFLTHRDKRNCLFKSALFFDEQLDQNDKSKQNMSAVPLMRKGELDFHSIPQQLGHAKLEMSKIIATGSYQIGHLIDKPNELDKSDFLSFFINNTNLLIVMLIGYFLTKLFIYLFFKLKKIKFNCSNLFSMDPRNCPNLKKVSFIISFFNIFLFINLSLLSNSIKTEKVIVKTDKFIDSFEKLNQTSKILTFHEDGRRLFTQSSHKSFLYQLYQKKSKKDEIYMIPSEAYDHYYLNIYELLKKNSITNFVFFMTKTRLLASFRLMSALASNYFLWIRSFNEELLCYYLSPVLNEKKKQILLFRIDSAFESGIYSDYMNRIERDLKLSILKKLKIFESLEEFTSYQYSFSSTDVQFDNYRTIFICYFGILILVLILFILDHLCRFIKIKFRVKLFYLITKNRLKKASIQKRIKTSKPIYKADIVVLNR